MAEGQATGRVAMRQTRQCAGPEVMGLHRHLVQTGAAPRGSHAQGTVGLGVVQVARGEPAGMVLKFFFAFKPLSDSPLCAWVYPSIFNLLCTSLCMWISPFLQSGRSTLSPAPSQAHHSARVGREEGETWKGKAVERENCEGESC